MIDLEGVISLVTRSSEGYILYVFVVSVDPLESHKTVRSIAHSSKNKFYEGIEVGDIVSYYTYPYKNGNGAVILRKTGVDHRIKFVVDNLRNLPVQQLMTLDQLISKLLTTSYNVGTEHEIHDYFRRLGIEVVGQTPKGDIHFRNLST